MAPLMLAAHLPRIVILRHQKRLRMALNTACTRVRKRVNSSGDVLKSSLLRSHMMVQVAVTHLCTNTDARVPTGE